MVRPGEAGTVRFVLVRCGMVRSGAVGRGEAGKVWNVWVRFGEIGRVLGKVRYGPLR